MSDSGRDFLRHTVATLAYRGGKVVRDAPAAFASYDGGTRSPAKILAHIGDLLDWAVSMADGSRQWRDSEAKAWDDEGARFFEALKTFDDYLASDAPLCCTVAHLLPGRIADSRK